MAKKVKIRLLASLAGEQVLPAGATIETSAAEAQSLVSNGYAEYVQEIRTATSKSAEKRQTTSRKPKKK